MRKAVIAIQKDENLYLDEWVTYYIRLGFDSIFILDNNEIGNDELHKVTDKYPQVSVIDVRGRDALIRHGLQQGCYQETYNQISKDFDWIGIFDIDEFLYIPEKIDMFLQRPVFNDTNCIHFNWRYYGDNNLIFYDPRPVQERFPIPCPDTVQYNENVQFENTWVKSLIRGKLDNMHILIHSAYGSNFVCRHANGKLEDGTHERSNIIDFSSGYIKHYGTKTITEYIQRRCWNPLNACGDTISATTRLNWFFNVNQHTPAKDKIAQFFYDRGL